MREAMAAAEVGDDVYGEDPTVARLEEHVAHLLGKEAALFTPTGTMAGQLGVREHVAPGSELIADSQSHVLRAEMGAAAALSGVTTRSWSAHRGRLETSAVASLIAPATSPYLVATRCVVVENTHNFGGGTIQSLETMREVADLAHRHGAAVHLDGARLWNAHVATGVPLADYAACAQTVAVCLSKGLGAPVGSLLAGSADAIATARVWRKRWGAGMRQVGVLAAAGLYALRHQLADLGRDHELAHQAAQRVAGSAPDTVDPSEVHTNIVVLRVGATGWASADYVAAAARRGVLGFATDGAHARFVWHRDITPHASEQAAGVLAELAAAPPGGG